MKVIVVGLDGAGFELIDPWINEGMLPNLAEIKRNGVWADMESVLPPVTSPNWKSYSTGKNPGKLGIFWWENIDWAKQRVYYPADRKHESKEIWDYISDARMKVVALGMPTTYPPKKVNGVLISGGPDAADSNFAYPAEIEKELKEKGWRNHPRTPFETDKSARSQEIREIVDASFKLAGELGSRYSPDFLQVTVFYLNNMHHFLWDDEETRRTWKLVDKHIGELKRSNCNLIVMSDHGSNHIHKVFNINAWLENEGYLKLKPNLSFFLYRLGINQQRILAILTRLRINGIISKLVPKRLIGEVPDAEGEIRKEAKAGKIDWRRSKAFASGQGPVYLNPANREIAECRLEIKRKLENLSDQSDGVKVVERVYLRDELYSGEYLAEAPDLIIDQAKGIHITGGIGPKNIFDSPQRWRAENKKNGLFMAWGPDIKSTGRIENISILDLAPTILHLMGISIPDDMDGRVIREAFRDDSEPFRRDITFRRSDEKISIRQKVRKFRSH